MHPENVSPVTHADRKARKARGRAAIASASEPLTTGAAMLVPVFQSKRYGVLSPSPTTAIHGFVQYISCPGAAMCTTCAPYHEPVWCSSPTHCSASARGAVTLGVALAAPI